MSGTGRATAQSHLYHRHLVGNHEPNRIFPWGQPDFSCTISQTINLSFHRKASLTTMEIAPGSRLGPYAVEALIGAGGMGQVYRAVDTRLGRSVALKVLPGAMLQDADHCERFDREARAVAALSHPHICALFDVGNQDGTRYLVMEYLEGQTLAERLATGPLPSEEVFKLGAQMAEALAAAHAKGVLHRDLKPANVMITANGLKLVDFGLAKIVQDERPQVAPDAPTTLATGNNTIMGTAHYMSPEQARGQEVDSRTDVWSFGVVLYEMLTGSRPFDGATPTDAISATLRDEIAWDKLPPTVPETVRSLLLELTRKDREQRPADLATVAAVLRAGLASPPSTATDATPTDGHSIAVIPFANNSPDADNEYFSDGLTEEVIADLSRIEALRVISRTTAMRLKGMEQDLKSIAHELNVRYVLEGSVRKAGNNLRITAQLIDTRTDNPIWADKYSGTLDDVFEIQEQVSRAIVDSLQVKLTKKEGEQLAAPAVNPQAYDAVLRARRDIWSFTEDGLERAVRELEHTLEVVGEDILLYHSLGLANWQYVNAGISGDPVYIERAEKYARRILAIDPHSHHGASLLGYIAVQKGDIVSWVRQMRKAVAAEPRNPDYLVWLAVGWLMSGHPERAVPLLDRLESIEPLLDLLQFTRGYRFYLMGDYEAALPFFRKAYLFTPNHPAWSMMIAVTGGSQGRITETVAEIEAKTAPPTDSSLARLTHVIKHALLGEGAAVDDLINDEFTAKMWPDLQYSFIMAEAMALLDRPEEAMKWLTRSVDRGFIHYPFLAEVDPLLANLRGTPPFVALMAQVREQWDNLATKVAP